MNPTPFQPYAWPELDQPERRLPTPARRASDHDGFAPIQQAIARAVVADPFSAWSEPPAPDHGSSEGDRNDPSASDEPGSSAGQSSGESEAMLLRCAQLSTELAEAHASLAREASDAAAARAQLESMASQLSAQRDANADMAENLLAALLNELAQSRLRVDEQAWVAAFHALRASAEGPGATRVRVHPSQQADVALALDGVEGFAERFELSPSPTAALGEMILEGGEVSWAVSIKDVARELRDILGRETNMAQGSP